MGAKFIEGQTGAQDTSKQELFPKPKRLSQVVYLADAGTLSVGKGHLRCDHKKKFTLPGNLKENLEDTERKAVFE